MSIAPPCYDMAASKQGRELVQHGTALFPIACYDEDMTIYSVPWHWHEDFEYIIATAGSVAVVVGKSRIVLKEGQGVFINSSVLHEVEFASQGVSTLHSGVFHPRLCGGMDTLFWQKYTAALLAGGAPPYFLLDGAQPWHAPVLAALQSAWEAALHEAAGYENLVRYHITEALRLLSVHLPTQAMLTSQQEQVDAARMKTMLSFIEEHYAGELSVESIAGCVSVSESACLRSFRKMLGTTPIQYVKQYRVEKAAQLLLATTLKAGEIGAECGFADVSYFTKTFREIKKCTPTEYRRRFGARDEF